MATTKKDTSNLQRMKINDQIQEELAKIRGL